MRNPERGKEPTPLFRTPHSAFRVGIGGWCGSCTHAGRSLSRFSGPGHCCSANHPKWSGRRDSHPRPPRSERGRPLLTLRPGETRSAEAGARKDSACDACSAFRLPRSALELALAEGVSPSSPALEAPCSVVELRERTPGRTGRGGRPLLRPCEVSVGPPAHPGKGGCGAGHAARRSIAAANCVGPRRRLHLLSPPQTAERTAATVCQPPAVRPRPESRVTPPCSPSC